MRTLAFTTLAIIAFGAIAVEKPRVLVARFDALNPDKPWIAKSLQSSLVAELTRQGVAPVAWPQPMADAAAALNLARAQGAAYVILGSTQTVDTDIRVTGQIINVATGQVTGGLKSTGAIRDIFAVQDELAAQVQSSIAAQVAPDQPMLAQPPAQPAPVQPPAQPPAANDALAAEIARAQALNRQLEQAIRRLEDAADRALDTPEPSYFRSGIYSPFFYGGYYPTYGFNRSYTVGGSGLSISGAYRGDNFVVGFRVGSGFSSSRGAGTVQGNYVKTGPMVMQPVRR
jgi:TolB-like protein